LDSATWQKIVEITGWAHQKWCQLISEYRQTREKEDYYISNYPQDKILVIGVEVSKEDLDKIKEIIVEKVNN
jgi:nitrogen regulatory protein PII-like uncharacterized protein